MPKIKTVKKVAKKIEKPYMASIKVFAQTFTAQGKTAREAIANLSPGNVKGRGILVIEKGGLRKERILMPQIVWRLFNSQGLMREIALKNASILFDGF